MMWPEAAVLASRTQHIGLAFSSTQLPEKQRHTRHPLIWWLEPIQIKRSKIAAPPGLIIDHDDSPEAHAFLSTAYDLYVVAHNASLQSQLTHRPRHPDQFRGAHYELQVIAAFCRAGFHIDFEDEGDSRSSHHEFTATYAQTGQTYSVECKARSFDSSSFATWEDALPHAECVKITRHVQRALCKKASHSRVIFVDVNYPHVDEEKPAWIEAVLSDLRGIEDRERPAEPYPPALVFFTNNDSRSFSSFDKLMRRVTILRPFKLLRWQWDWNGEMQRNPGIYALMRSLDVHKRIPHEFYRLGATGEVVEDSKGPRR